LTQISLLAGAWLLGKNRSGRYLSLLIAVFSLSAIDIIYLGQVDIIFIAAPALLGLVALYHERQWWFAFALLLLVVKPPNGVAIAIVLWLMSLPRFRWSPFVLGGVALVISFLIHGEWLSQWISAYRANPPNDWATTTLFRMLYWYDLPLWIGLFACAAALLLAGLLSRRLIERQDREMLLALWVGAIYFVSPYSVSYHFAVLAALVAPTLLARAPLLILALYPAFNATLLRGPLGFQPNGLEWITAGMVYLVVAGYLIWQERHLNAADVAPSTR
jgi:hypothetical protein